MTIALVGNQNCGKTTLYNAISGKTRHVGNFPGVTVDAEASRVPGIEGCEIIDLPGVYSLRAYSDEERVTRDHLLRERPDGIINVVDATSIERGLYLTTRVLELGIPTVVALNMMDEVERRGGSVDTVRLGAELGVPVAAISASRRQGIEELLNLAVVTVRGGKIPEKTTRKTTYAEYVREAERIITTYAEKCDIPCGFAAALALEGDPDVITSLDMSKTDKTRLVACVREFEQKSGSDAVAAAVSARYEYVDGICRKYIRQAQNERSRLDAIVLEKFIAYPLFFSLIALIFYVTFDVLGGRLTGITDTAIGMLADVTGERMAAAHVHPVLASLVVDGIFAGVGAVLSFLPTVVLLFFFLSILEDTGYMARVAFIMDAPMRRLGLSGKSIVPLLFGFGCSVPAVMAARTLPTERDRRTTVMLVPYMSCGAKIPIYAIFASSFFPGMSAAVTASIYAGGVAVAVTMAYLMRKFGSSAEGDAEYILELPEWRLPTARGVRRLLIHRTKEFLSRAFGVIFLASVAVWFTSTFDSHLNVTYDVDASILASAGRLIAPLFAPLGFGDWRAAAALIAGLSAKEAVLGTLAILLGSGSIANIFTPASAVSFLSFTLLYTPCAAAVTAMRCELGGWRAVLRVIIIGFAVAWTVSAIVYRAALPLL